MRNLTQSAKGAIVGLFLVALGGIFLLDQFGVLRADFAFRLFWPAVLIAFGLVCVLQPPNRGRMFWGGLILLLGIMMMVNALGIARVRYEFFWPLWLIAAGVWMLASRSGYIRRQYPPTSWPGTPPPSSPQPPAESAPPSSSTSFGSSPMEPQQSQPSWQAPPWVPRPPGQREWWTNRPDASRNSWAGSWSQDIPPSMESTIDYTAVFHHIERRIVAKNFRGGKLAVVFGGFTIDLREADIDGPVAFLHADAIFGGGEIFVPDNWDISMRGSGVFGGYSNETLHRPLDGTAKRLVIEGAAVFGGIVVKN